MFAPRLPMTAPQTETLVTIGRILKPFGVRGEVKVESLSDVPGRFEGLNAVYLTRSHDAAQPLATTVTQVREVPAGYLISFSAFSTPEEAAHFRGAWIQIPQTADLPRDGETFYQFELIGLRVEDPDGHYVGQIEEIIDYPQHHVLVVRREGTEVLIPATQKIIKTVDLENHCVHISSKEWWDIDHAL